MEENQAQKRSNGAVGEKSEKRAKEQRGHESALRSH